MTRPSGADRARRTPFPRLRTVRPPPFLRALSGAAPSTAWAISGPARKRAPTSTGHCAPPRRPHGGLKAIEVARPCAGREGCPAGHSPVQRSTHDAQRTRVARTPVGIAAFDAQPVQRQRDPIEYGDAPEAPAPIASPKGKGRSPFGGRALVLRAEPRPAGSRPWRASIPIAGAPGPPWSWRARRRRRPLRIPSTPAPAPPSAAGPRRSRAPSAHGAGAAGPRWTHGGGWRCPPPGRPP